MRSYRTKQVIALAVILSIVAVTQASIPVVPVRDHDRWPDLPSPLCDSLQVGSENKLVYRAYAVGAQRYRWDGTAWIFVEPVATLYSDEEYHQKVGVHYLGPTWLANSGGKVVATKLQGCTPDPTAVPWLLLQTVTNDGPGVFGSVGYIQRINTRGGLVPTAPGTSIGALADVPYTAEYYFYRSKD